MTVVDGQGRTARAPGLARWLARVAPRNAVGEVTIALVPDARMRSLNRRYRRRDYATDVLSFAADGDLGDIVIARGVAARQAREEGHPVATELRLLTLHGLLHLLGYDHETDRGQMRRLERRLRRRGGLERPHIHSKRLRPARGAGWSAGEKRGPEGPRRRARASGGGAGPRLKGEGRRLKCVPGARCLESARRAKRAALSPREARSRRAPRKVAGAAGGAPARREEAPAARARRRRAARPRRPRRRARASGGGAPRAVNK